MDKVPMTVRGEQLLRQELERLLKRRPLITQAIAEARELGDLKENAEYHAAREEQVFAKRKSATSNTNCLLLRLSIFLKCRTTAK